MMRSLRKSIAILKCRCLKFSSKWNKNGVLIDTKLLDQQTVQLNAQAQKLEEQAFEAAGEKFKLSSPKQLGEILFDKMGVVLDGAKPKKTVSGNYSTSEEVLSELAQNYPLAKDRSRVPYYHKTRDDLHGKTSEDG